MTTSFEEDQKRGKKGEQIFKEDYLDFLGIKYEDVSEDKAYQQEGFDFVTDIGNYEVKANYRDNQLLIFEEWYKHETVPGWIYTTQADVIVFVSLTTRTMIILPLTDRFRYEYEYIKLEVDLQINEPSAGHYQQKWTSSFRKIPFDMLTGYISAYKRKPFSDQIVSLPSFLK